MMQHSLSVAVLRVSTGEQVAGTSLPEQEAACRALAAKLGLSLVAVYSDEGKSGTRFTSRAGLQSAIRHLARLREQDPDANLKLIFSAVDRATREAAVLPAIRQALRPIRAEIVYANVSIDNSASGRFMESTFGSVAAFEREMIRERTTRGKEARAREGIQTARGLRPYGYDLVMKKDVYPGSKYEAGDIGRYFVREDEARALRQVFAQYGAGAFSLRGAAAWMNERGYLTTQGNPWSVTGVRTVLQNPLYKGEARYGRWEHWIEERGDGVTRKKTPRGTSAIVIPCPAIAAPEVWEQCRERLAINQRALGGNESRKYLLSGLLFCPSCGERLCAHAGRKAGLQYGCRGLKGCGAHVPAGRIEPLLLKAIHEVATRPDVVSAALAALQDKRRRGVPGFDGASLRRELARLEAEAAAAAKLEIRAVVEERDAAPYRANLTKLSGRMAEIRHRLESESVPAVKSASVSAGPIIELLQSAAWMLGREEASVMLRNRALHALIESVTPFEDGTEPGDRAGRPRKRWAVQIRLRSFSTSKNAHTVQRMLTPYNG